MSVDKFAAICALLLTGCAATPEGDHSNESQVAAARAEKGNSKKFCTREKPLGSNLPRVVCYSRGQLDARSQSLESVLRRERVRSTESPGPRANVRGLRRDG